MSTTASITSHALDTRIGGVGRTTNRPARVWTVGLAAGVVAAVATSLTAAVATAVGADIEVDGEVIPAGGFAVLTLVGAVLGIAIAKLARRMRRPRTVFVATTVTLTALSVIPDVVADATWTTRLVLAATHLIAAAIIIPTVARRVDA